VKSLLKFLILAFIYSMNASADVPTLSSGAVAQFLLFGNVERILGGSLI